MTRKILGVRIDDVSSEEALSRVRAWLRKNPSLEKNDSFKKTRIIVTPGPEFLLTAQRDEGFREVLNSSDLSIPDGFGLRLYAGVKNRIPGRVFMERLCGEAAGNGWTIGLVGGWTGEGDKVKKELEKKFPKIRVVQVIDGDKATQIKNGYDIYRYIKKPIDILFVAFGHPWQERTISNIKYQISNRTSQSRGLKVRVAMGVGGAFDYLAGRYPEVPKIAAFLGLEWFWRLLTQPRRLGRILRATFLFPLLLLADKFGKRR